ncbi:hypothetical protein PV387_40680 [Streptomyces sp. ME02-6987-2C]|nr:hypothetical protein [Streptomyces sp. ME02-6987-2C]
MSFEPSPDGLGTTRTPQGPAPDHQRSPVAPRAPAPISHRLKPRLATALFRRYLRACVPTGPDRVA